MKLYQKFIQIYRNEQWLEQFYNSDALTFFSSNFKAFGVGAGGKKKFSKGEKKRNRN
jgi:hypothetical protein